MNVGIIGCGNIAPAYINSHKLYNNFKVIACADIVHEVAKKSAEEHNVKAQTVEEILLNDDISLIINLTVPSSHKEIIMRSLEAGKHCYSEKPLAINFKDGLAINNLAKEKKLIVGCAPDTFLGGAGQAMEGLGSLAQGWAAMKNLKLTRQAMENQQNQWQSNFDAQALAVNNQISNQNAWKQASGHMGAHEHIWPQAFLHTQLHPPP